MTNLRKCPKCGGEPVLITERDDSDRLDIHMYQCCGVNGMWNATKDDCEDDWNYDEEVVGGEIERLKAENKRLECCGNCERWEIDTERSPYFMDTDNVDCEHGDPSHKCDKWEERAND